MQSSMMMNVPISIYNVCWFSENLRISMFVVLNFTVTTAHHGNFCVDSYAYTIVTVLRRFYHVSENTEKLQSIKIRIPSIHQGI